MPNQELHRTWLHSERFIPRQFIRPALRFTQVEAASGIVLLVAAVIAIIWANSSFGDSYQELWETSFKIELGSFHLEETLRGLVNDGLMAVFFLVVGLEIKRELVVGELRDPKAAALPAIAALGGMVVPALIFLAFVAGQGGEAARGWGIPMATDIAFSIGVVALLGSRVSVGAKLFLLALAIVDDIGAIAVIAVFYTEDLLFSWLAAALITLILIWAAQKGGIRAWAFY
ncbi:MAG: Na+/H+ antiporter NhaA, partial [Acidimicrobiia bacterium]